MKCPHCAGKKINMGENHTLIEDREMRKGETYQERYENWQMNGEKRLSSQAMFSHFTGKKLKTYDCPIDIY